MEKFLRLFSRDAVPDIPGAVWTYKPIKNYLGAIIIFHGSYAGKKRSQNDISDF
jgi:hypothetical protein